MLVVRCRAVGSMFTDLTTRQTRGDHFLDSTDSTTFPVTSSINREVVQKDCHARKLNREDCSRWKKLIKIV